jgi:hypothetical protein
MQEVDPLIPDSVAYPLENAVALGGYRYLTGTPAMSIALGLLQVYDEIHMYGVELSFTEYQYQAECLRYWVGLAKGKLGADKMVMHCAEHLFEAPLYGYDGNFAFGKEFFEARRDELDKEWTEQERKLQRLKDKLMDTVTDMKFEKAQEQTQEFQQLALNVGEISGALAEAERYAGFGDRYADRGGFEYSAAVGQREGEEQRVAMFRLIGKMELVGDSWVHVKSNSLTDSMRRMLVEVGKAAYNTGANLGKYRENISYIKKYDETHQANGNPFIREVSADAQIGLQNETVR